MRTFNCYRVRDVEEQLHALTAAQSRFEANRAYLGMSDASLPVNKIVERYFEQRNATLRAHLLCYKGYQMEDDVIRRYREYLMKLNPTAYSIRDYQIEAFDGMVKGHPDLLVMYPKWSNSTVAINSTVPTDVKSLPSDELLPLRWEDISLKAQMQMQAYLHFTKLPMGRMIFESRENGFFRVFDVTRMPAVGQEIEDKFTEAINIINEEQHADTTHSIKAD